MADATRAPRFSTHALGVLSLFVACLAPLLAFHLATPVIEDTDSYFHLAVARAYRAEGVTGRLPWARFSLLHDRYGDKELLFHVGLMPFVGNGTSTTGGRVALALIGAALLALVSHLGARMVGPWGLVLGPFLLLTCGDLDLRLMRLRPELPALGLLLLATDAAARGRTRRLAVLACLFALSYTAWQALGGLVLLWFVARTWQARRPAWELLLHPLMGLGLGIVIHPSFPANIDLWVAQNIDYHRLRPLLDVGNEIGAPLGDQTLLRNLGFWIGLGAVIGAWRSRSRHDAPTGPSRATGPGDGAPWLVAAVCFTVLFALGWRFAIYFFPFAALATLALTGGLSRPTGRGAVGLLLAGTLASAPWVVPIVRDFLGTGHDTREARGHDLSSLLPVGARVAAPWGLADVMVYYAPQARYLNVLDPVFMAVPYPFQYAAQRALFDGAEPDIPLVAGTLLASDYVAFQRGTSARLEARTAVDPRLEPLMVGPDLLYRVVAGRNDRFWLDWTVAPTVDPPWGGVPPPPSATPIPYPRATDPRARDLEGFVDAGRAIAPGRCVLLHTELSLPGSTSMRLELAASGPVTIWIDQARRAATASPGGAVLGQGLLIDLRVAAGAHTVDVATCADPTTGRTGFYLVER